jgi:hypothetical protein
VKRTLLVVAAGLIGLLLGIGVSLVADAVAGNELSDPVPLGIATENHRAPASPHDDRPKETPSPAHDQNDGGSGANAGAGGGATETQAPPSPEPTETESGDGSGSHDDDSTGGSEGSDDD